MCYTEFLSTMDIYPEGNDTEQTMVQTDDNELGWCQLSKAQRALRKRQQRAYAAVESWEKIPAKTLFSIEPTEVLCLVNGGADQGVTREHVFSALSQLSPVHDVILQPGRGHCFVLFASPEDAATVKEALHDRVSPELFGPASRKLLYIEYAASIPALFNEAVYAQPAGTVPDLVTMNDFLTEEEEKKALDFVDSQPWHRLSKRHVQHYGYVFDYSTNAIDRTAQACAMPGPLNEVLQAVVATGLCPCVPEQLTVNQYLPGSGIPPHVDTHSEFEDGLVVVSLGSSTVMDFRRPDGKHVAVPAPRRSLLIMQGESQRGWTHGISQRKYDYQDGKYTPRERRVSLTFRKLRRKPCLCPYRSLCDTALAEAEEEANSKNEEKSRQP